MADVHGFYTEMISALKEKGYFDDKSPHKLIVCGDLFDRGSEAKEMQRSIVWMKIMKGISAFDKALCYNVFKNSTFRVTFQCSGQNKHAKGAEKVKVRECYDAIPRQLSMRRKRQIINPYRCNRV